MKTAYRLRFREYQRHGLPRKPGIYCVYSASFRLGKIWDLLYIGRATNIWKRVDPNTHRGWPDWEDHVNDGPPGRNLLFTAASTSSDLKRVEDALIYWSKPLFNTTGVESFSHDETTITTAGDNYLLDTRFTVGRS